MAAVAPISGTLQLPLGQLARISATPGPAMINSENGQLRALVQLNVRGRDMGSFVDDAKAASPTTQQVKVTLKADADRQLVR